MTTQNIKLTISDNIPTEIERFNGEWICPYCLKNFKNRRSNLRTHLYNQFERRQSNKKLCSEAIGKVDLNKLKLQIKYLVKVAKPKKMPVKEKKDLIHTFDKVKFDTSNLEKDWRYYDLKELVYKLIKATYTSDYRWLDNCICTAGQYFKIKQNFNGENKWLTEYKMENGKFIKLTKKKFTGLMIRICLRYLKSTHKEFLKKSISLAINRKFYKQYMDLDLNYTVPMEDQIRMKNIFLKRRRTKYKKAVEDETSVKEWSTDSDIDIETRPPTPNIKNMKTCTFNHAAWLAREQEICNQRKILRMKAEIEKNSLLGLISLLTNEDKDNRDFLITKMPNCELKTRLIVHYEEQEEWDSDDFLESKYD
jgi:hypothetical protein